MAEERHAGSCKESQKDMFLEFLSECSKSRSSGILRTREKAINLQASAQKGQALFPRPFPQRHPLDSNNTALCSPCRPHPELTQSNVDNVEGEDIDGEQRQGEDEEVEVAVVPLPHAVAHPGAVMVKPLCKESSAQISRANAGPLPAMLR